MEKEEAGPNPANLAGSRVYFQPLPVALATASPPPPSSISKADGRGAFLSPPLASSVPTLAAPTKLGERV